MSEEISLDIAMSKEEMNKIKDLLTSTPGLRHFAMKLKNGEYLDLVEYKDYEILEQENQQLKDRINMTKNINRKNKELKERVEQLELVLDEIKKYIGNNELFNYILDEEELFEYVSDEKEKSELLQILDKVGKE